MLVMYFLQGPQPGKEYTPDKQDSTVWKRERAFLSSKTQRALGSCVVAGLS